MPRRSTSKRSKLTPAVQRNICNALREGLTRKAASGAAGIDRSTFHRWFVRGEDPEQPVLYRNFRDAVVAAESSNERELVNIAMNIARGLPASVPDGDEAPQAPRPADSLRAASFLLERRYGWHAKTEVTGPDGGALQVTTTIVTELPDPERGRAVIRSVLGQVEILLDGEQYPLYDD